MYVSEYFILSVAGKALNRFGYEASGAIFAAKPLAISRIIAPASSVSALDCILT